MKYEQLKIENQLCFPLYAASKEIVNRYKPFLAELDLTYTQYITMMVLWEYEKISVKDLGEKLFLDSGTLTPLLKILECKGYIEKERKKDDERVVIVRLTEGGVMLQEKAKTIPSRIGSCVNLTKEEAVELYRLLYKVLEIDK